MMADIHNNKLKALKVNALIESERKLPIKVIPFKHQVEGYALVCRIFHLYEEVIQ